MSDIDRVREMADEGRITKEEADQLIAVLRDVEAAEANLEAAGGAGSTARPSAAPQAQEAPPAPRVPEPPPAPSAPGLPPAPPAQEPPPAPVPPPAQEPPPTPEVPPTPEGPPAPPVQEPPAPQPPPAPQEPSADPTDFGVSAAFGDAARDIARQAREAAREASRASRDAAREARDAVRQAAREARDSARVTRDVTRDASRQAREVGREVRQAASGHGRLEVDDIGERPDRAIAPAGTQWVTVEMIGGDLDITVDPTLTVPVADGGPGNIEVQQDAEGYKVKFMPDRGNVLDRFLSSLRSGDLDVRIPPHFGVSIQATAGDIDLHGVRYLRGRLRAGDVSADRLEGVDFALMAGEFDATLDLKGGDHVITIGAGDASVALPSDADVTVTGRVSIGDLDSRVDGLEERGSGLGGEVAGVLGAGSAKLRLRVTTGDLSIRAARPGADRG